MFTKRTSQVRYQAKGAGSDMWDKSWPGCWDHAPIMPRPAMMCSEKGQNMVLDVLGTMCPPVPIQSTRTAKYLA